MIPDISIIVCTMNRPADMARLLASLRAQTLAPREMAVVDASPGAETREIVETAAREAPFRLAWIPEQPSTSRQRNTGFRHTDGEVVLFLDDDVVLEPDCLEVLARAFARFRGTDVGGITGRITNQEPEWRVGDVWFKRLFLLTGRGRRIIQASGLPEHPAGPVPGYTQVMFGCCMGLFREAFARHQTDGQLSGYAYMEDVDLCRRLGKTHRMYYEPRARLAHHSTTHRGDTRRLRALFLRHHWYFFRKNSPRTPLHILAFLWSVVGLFTYNLVVARNIQGFLGLLDALASPGKGMPRPPQAWKEAA